MTPRLPVVYPPQHLITIPSFSEFYYVVQIFQYWFPITLPNMLPMWAYVLTSTSTNMAVWTFNRCLHVNIVGIVLFSSLISCDNVQQTRLVGAWIIVIHCNDQSLHRTFPIINDTKYRLRKRIFCGHKMVENESERVLNMRVLWTKVKVWNNELWCRISNEECHHKLIFCCYLFLYEHNAFRWGWMS